MQHCGFTQGVEVALQRDQRFARQAYFFLRDALEQAVASQSQDGNGRSRRDVRGQQLALAFRDHALTTWGPLASVVLEEWGIRRSEDVGEMVYLLIELGIFGRSEEDRKEDFAGQWNNRDAFNRPFEPPSARQVEDDAVAKP